MLYFIPILNTNVLDLAKKFLKEIWRLHEVLETIISDKDTRFTSHWRQNFCDTIKVKTKMSTVFHPKTDRQTE
jgi:hypothetical protein